MEKIRERIQENITYEEAIQQVQATTVFTTHTPVPAGHDVFPFPLMDKYFSRYYPLLGLNRDAFLQLGISPKEPTAGFNMTAFALRMSAYRNGVSKRHAEVARRFAVYKRADLIFDNLERLKVLLNNRWRPVQIIFAGKAHPADDAGKRILQRIFNFAHDPAMGGRIAFVEGYDEQLAQYMTHGVDIWLNNPLPPMEACGTSGMKASLNGVPHLSILDGWWIEGFNGRNGWAFAGQEGENRDAGDAEAIYNILEKEVIPLYYKVDDDGIPRDWVNVMKEAIKSTGPVFSARRMVEEYARKFYQNALKSA